MARLSESVVFNNPEVFADGWYWALPSKELKAGKVLGLEILGRNLAVYRGKSGSVRIFDAYCPHMGAHFKEGRVVGEDLHCAFHNWKFNSSGKCIEIPCTKYRDRTAAIPPVKTYPVREAYGLIWLHTGTPLQAANDPLPQFAELPPDSEMEIVMGPRTYRQCRPEVVMLNAIDAHHFNSVHPEVSTLAGGMDLRANVFDKRAVRLSNVVPPPLDSRLGRFLKRFYEGAMTYYLDYWYGSTAAVTLGPDFLHLYLMFPHRPTVKGGTEGIMLYLTPKRKGFFGKLISRAIVRITSVAGSYFEKGDIEIFASIRFSMQAPVKADHAIIQFIRHVETLATKPLPWNEADEVIEKLRRIIPEGEESPDKKEMGSL